MPSKDTAYTKEGTLAHSCAEKLLNYLLNRDDKVLPNDEAAKRMLRSPGLVSEDFCALYGEIKSEGYDPEEMAATVYYGYVVLVWAEFANACKTDREAKLIVEARLDLSDYVPEGFGSSDAVIISSKHLHVFDLKYGKGVAVSANHNPQMMCYALGALLGPGELYTIQSVTMTIIQPRLSSVSSCNITYGELMSWARDILKPAAIKAYAGEGEPVPGPHCRFCRVAPRCRALSLYADRTRADYGDPRLLAPEELGTLLSKLDTISGWLSSVGDYALDYVSLQGGKIPGWKLVAGRSIRQISDKAAVMTELDKSGIASAEYLRAPELKTITELEKLLGKKPFNDLLGAFIVKPAGKPTLVPDSDKRPEINKAETDFADAINQ